MDAPVEAVRTPKLMRGVVDFTKEAGPRPSAEGRVDAGRDAGPPWWRRFAIDDPTAEEEQAPKDLVFSCSRKPSA